MLVYRGCGFGGWEEGIGGCPYLFGGGGLELLLSREVVELPRYLPLPLC